MYNHIQYVGDLIPMIILYMAINKLFTKSNSPQYNVFLLLQCAILKLQGLAHFTTGYKNYMHYLYTVYSYSR